MVKPEVALVTLSESEAPSSSSVARSTVPGLIVGPVVSTVIDKAMDLEVEAASFREEEAVME